MNWLSAITASVVTAAGAGMQYGVIPAKYAGYAMMAAAIIQAFQGAVHKSPAPATNDAAQLQQSAKAATGGQ